MSAKNNKISYDDILAKMGMYVEDGKLHKGKNPIKPNVIKECLLPQSIDINKNLPHVKKIISTNKPEEIKPVFATKDEYINYLVQRKISKLFVKKSKSTKLIMPVENINVSSKSSPNVLFDFSTPINRINLKGNTNI